jgi:hypothetical protein
MEWMFAMRGCMKHFSMGLSKLDLTEFTPRVSAEVKQSVLETVQDAAVSRLRPIQDGPDMWALHRSSAVTQCCYPTGKRLAIIIPIRLGTTLYQRCKAYETVRVGRTRPPQSGGIGRR